MDEDVDGQTWIYLHHKGGGGGGGSCHLAKEPLAMGESNGEAALGQGELNHPPSKKKKKKLCMLINMNGQISNQNYQNYHSKS